MLQITHEPANNEWTIKHERALTNDEAAGIMWRATPEQVTMGAFVSVEDANGTRIGHVAKAEYVERWNGPAYVNVSLELR